MDEAGPSRRSGRRVARVRYDVVPEIEGLDEDEPRASSSGSSPSPIKSIRGTSKRKSSQARKLKAGKHHESASSEGSDFQMANEDEDEDDEFVADDGIEHQDSEPGTPIAELDEQDLMETDGDMKSKKKKQKPGSKTVGTWHDQDVSSMDNADFPDDRAIFDFNAIYDNGFVYGYKYTQKRENARTKNFETHRHQIPLHPIGLTRLTSEPDLASTSQVESNPQAFELKEHDMLLNSNETALTAPLEIPWDLWRGEGWWPECWSYDTPDKPTWTDRNHVDVGLHSVGRCTREQLDILDSQSGRTFLPKRLGDQTLTLHLEPPPNDNTSGPQPTQWNAFDARSLGGPTKPGSFLFDAGGHVSGLEWCPLSEQSASSRQYKQYLAVSTLDPTTQPNRLGGLEPDLKGNIQIWSMTPQKKEPTKDKAPESTCLGGKMKCELVVCVSGGPVIDLKWMPIGCKDNVSLCFDS